MKHEGRSDLTTEGVVARIDTALCEANTITRRQRFFETIAEMRPDNWEAVFKQFLTQTVTEGRKHDFEWETMLTRIGEVDGPRAIEKFMTDYKADANPMEIARCLTGWAAKDAAAAQTWFDALPDGPRKSNLTGRLIEGLTQSDPSRAMAFVATLPPEQQGAYASVLVGGTIQSGGLRAAQEMFDQARRASPHQGADPLTAAVFREVGERVFFSNWIGKTPENACRWVTDHIGQPYLTPQIVAHAANDYAIIDPTAALHWVDRNASQFGEQHTAAAIDSVVRRWMGDGITRLTQWVEAHEGEPLRDQVSAAFVAAIAPRDAEAARQWTATITDETARAKAQAEIERATAPAARGIETPIFSVRPGK